MISSIPATQLGLVNSFIYIDIIFHAAIDFDPGDIWSFRMPSFNSLGVWLEGIARFRGEVKLGPTVTATTKKDYDLVPTATLPAISFAIGGLPFWMTPSYGVKLTVELKVTLTADFNYVAYFYQTVKFGVIYNKLSRSGVVASFPEPDISIPPPGLLSITAVASKLTATLKPVLSLKVFVSQPALTSHPVPQRRCAALLLRR